MSAVMSAAPKLKVAFEGEPPPNTAFDVFAFSSNGTLIGKSTMKAGEAIDLDDVDAFSHVFVTQSGLVGKHETPTMAKLHSLRAYQPVIKKKGEQVTALPIPEHIWKGLLKCCGCRVHGHVLAEPLNLPVPFARVHISEIDVLFIIHEMPRFELFRLRDDILRVAIPRPIPNPPDPPYRIAELSPIETILGPTAFATLQTDSEPLLRETLRAHIKKLVPWWHHFPWFLHRHFVQDELAVVETNVDGRFDAYINGCTLDIPDLYFSVEALIDDVWTTVYSPAILSSTYWNYQSGQEVILTIDDPRVVPARPTPVATKGVEILRLGTKYIPSIDPVTGLLPDDTPFGGTICPVVSFANVAAVATHYQWQYRRFDETQWHDLTREVVHHYRERHEISPTNIVDHIRPYRLGPIGPLHLYKIPPVSAQDLAAPGFTAWWVMYANPGDEVSGYFESNAGATEREPISGKFELRLRLFKNVSVDGSTATAVVSTPANDPFSISDASGNAVTPPAALLELDSAGNVVAFRTTIFVDNAKCGAAIHPVKVGSTSADACGMLHATAGDAEISFVAWHPRGYATFDFSLTRGRNAPDTVSGSVMDPTVGPYTGNHMTFSRSEPVVRLLGPCGGGAAFAEEVNVYAKATDGYQRLWYLDAHAVAPFAIVP